MQSKNTAIIEKTLKALEENNMQAFYVESKNEVCNKIEALLSENDTVSFGGSETLKECGVFNLLRCGKYNLLDRSKEGLSSDDIQKIYRDSFYADAYLCSSNAITEKGELYNVDGNGNRVSAIMFGPKSVIIVAGYNKIVPTIDDAVTRVKTVASPKNCVRLNCNTYCAKFGKCISAENGFDNMTDGCTSERRICADYTVLGRQRIKNRIKVILVGEELGY